MCHYNGTKKVYILAETNNRTSPLKIVPRDFLPPVFFFKQLLLAPVDKPSNDFDFFSNIRGDIRLFRCFAGVNDTGNACIAGVIDTGE